MDVIGGRELSIACLVGAEWSVALAVSDFALMIVRVAASLGATVLLAVLSVCVPPNTPLELTSHPASLRSAG